VPTKQDPASPSQDSRSTDTGANTGADTGLLRDFRMPLGGHLDELRTRVVYALLGLVPIAVVAFYFGDKLLDLILTPARNALHKGGQSDPVAIGPLELFSAYMRVSMLAAIVVGGPWILYQLWKFISPGLYRHEKRFAYFLIPLSAILTASGVIFLFQVVLPLILSFLIAFGASLHTPVIATGPLPQGVTLPSLPVLAVDPPLETLTPGNQWINSTLQKLRVVVAGPDGTTEILSQDLYKETGYRQQFRVSEVLSMMLTLILAFAGAFQTPLVVLLLGWAGLVDQKFLRKYRRHAVLVCAVIAAAVMPGDPASMISMAVPLYLLYELGGLLLLIFPVRRIRGMTDSHSSRWESEPDETSSSTGSSPGSSTSEDQDDRP
jgi:sec-independent protein translocase protein TatC